MSLKFQLVYCGYYFVFFTRDINNVKSYYILIVIVNVYINATIIIIIFRAVYRFRFITGESSSKRPALPSQSAILCKYLNLFSSIYQRNSYRN